MSKKKKMRDRALPPPAATPLPPASLPGGTADVFQHYARPLLDGTDGSPEQMQVALSIAQLCWNVSLIKDPSAAEDTIRQMKGLLPFGDDEFEQFRRDIIDMMLERHRQLFPDLHQSKGD